MTMQQAKVLKGIEDLLVQRFDLLKLYPVLSAQAMQCLENDDAEGFGKKLDERGLLIRQADALQLKMDTLVSQLDTGRGAIVTSLLKPGPQNTDCPEWGANIARSVEHTYKLLQSCALFDDKIMARAKTVSAEIQGQLVRIRSQRKINTAYSDQNTTPYGTRIHFSSK